MDIEDRHQLKRLAADLPARTRLRLVLTRHAESDRFQGYGRALQETLPAIDLVPEVRSDSGPPWMETEAGIRFQALPGGNKLAGFADALRPPGLPHPSIPQDQQEWLDRLALPMEIRLYIAPGCPFCPQAMQQWIALARAGRHLRLRVIDGALFPGMARKDAIQAVPTLVIDRHMRWSGRIPVREVLEQLVTRDPGRLSSEALDGLIKEGLARQVAQAMVAQKRLFPPIIDLLTHGKWPVRLGAMVVVEEIAALDHGLAAEVVPLLHQRYADLEDTVRGDVLYIIGETGDEAIAPFLHDVATASGNADVRQAAGEALASIRQRREDGPSEGP